MKNTASLLLSFSCALLTASGLSAAHVETKVQTTRTGDLFAVGRDGETGEKTHVDFRDRSTAMAGHFLRYNPILDDEYPDGVIITKFDRHGQVLWTNTYDVPNTKPNLLAQDRRGHLHLFGYSFNTTEGYYHKYNTRGRELPASHFPAPGPLSFPVPSFTRAEAVVFDSHNHMFLAHDSLVSRFTPRGQRLWFTSLPVARWLNIQVDGRGNSYALGVTPALSRVLFKLDRNGVPLWTNDVGGSDERPLAVDRRGNAYVSVPGPLPYTNTLFGTNVVALYGYYPGLVKLTASGVPAWTNILHGTNAVGDLSANYPETLVVEALATAPNGDICLTGRRFFSEMPYPGPGPTYEVVTCRAKSSGEVVWTDVRPLIGVISYPSMRIRQATRSRLESVLETAVLGLPPEEAYATKHTIIHRTLK